MTTIENLWKTMENHKGTVKNMKNLGKPWETTLKPWKTMENHEKLPQFSENHKKPWKITKHLKTLPEMHHKFHTPPAMHT